MLQTTRLSKVISAILITLYAVNYFVPDTSSYLALVPGRTLPCVWNLVTAGFMITNPIEVGEGRVEAPRVACKLQRPRSARLAGVLSIQHCVWMNVILIKAKHCARNEGRLAGDSSTPC